MKTILLSLLLLLSLSSCHYIDGRDEYIITSIRIDAGNSSIGNSNYQRQIFNMYVFTSIKNGNNFCISDTSGKWNIGDTIRFN